MPRDTKPFLLKELKVRQSFVCKAVAFGILRLSPAIPGLAGDAMLTLFDTVKDGDSDGRKAVV